MLDINSLHKYGQLILEDHQNKIYEISFKKLSEPNSLEFVHRYAEKLKAQKLEVAATYFSSSFGYICAAFQMVLSTQNMSLPIKPSTTVQIFHNKEYDYYALAYKFNEWLPNEAKQVRGSDWRREQLTSFYQGTVAPILMSLSQVTGIRIRELWGQLLIGLHYGHQVGLDNITEVSQLIALKEDYNWLIQEANPSIFLSDSHPLRFPHREVESLREPDKMIRMKPTCCLYYETSDSRNTKCYTCPRLSEAERGERRKKALMAKG
ncbi:(2Fe-2S)-binding protein [Bacillus solitudinis]|uniref:(2Fe-2S)-binding protein n=1 Tax=Bacillus solitudinis TaxID=2014074 RepID=UPI000C245CFE|nr:(2Fe-2S)-binding protein [Bacillus solitudinis]